MADVIITFAPNNGLFNLKIKIMALWKISVKFKTVKSGYQLEPGMSVEMSTPSTTPPLGLTKYREEISALFKSKYGVDINPSYIGASYFICEKI